MRILFVNQYYWPDIASTGQHLTDLAEHLAATGHAVRVVCSRGEYLAGKGMAPAREVQRGVEILRVRGTRFGQRCGISARILDYAAFHVAVAHRVALGRWADVVVTLTTPPLVGLWGALAQRLGRARGTKHVAWFMDLHPEAEFELGLVRPASALGRILRMLAGLETRFASRAVALGPYQAQRIAARGLAPQRIAQIPVWSSKDEVAPCAPADNPLRAQYGWQGRFVVLYSGNAGLMHRFDEILDAAQIVAARAPDVLFAFVGGGPRRAEIEREVARRGLGNVEFRGYVPRAALRHALPAGDVHFVSLEPNQTGVAVPGKLYGILAAGRPVLFVGAEHCETADTLREHACGFGFKPGEGAGLARAILELRADRELRERLSTNARRAFLAHFERDVCAAAWERLLRAVHGAPAPGAGTPPERLRLPRERRTRVLESVAPALPNPRNASRLPEPNAPTPGARVD